MRPFVSLRSNRQRPNRLLRFRTKALLLFQRMFSDAEPRLQMRAFGDIVEARRCYEESMAVFWHAKTAHCNGVPGAWLVGISYS